MINRAYIQVDGPPCSGKTSLVERLLESNRSKRISAIRFLESDSLDKPAEDRSGNEETKRFRKVGVDGTLLCRYPTGKGYQAIEYYWNSGFLMGYDPDGVIIEGRRNLDFNPDALVFITRPLSDNERLIFKEKREVARLDFKDYFSLVTGEKIETDPIIYEEGDEPEEEILFDDEIVEENIIEIPDEVAEYVRHGFPVEKDMWCLKESHAGIAKASVVMINIYGEDERPAAERLAEDIRRIREDEEIGRDIVGFYGSHRSQSVYITNLADRWDKELKKALSRIKRLAFSY